MWSFHQAPPEFRELFPAGAGDDWVTHVPLEQRQMLEPTLLRWNAAYPVRSKELEDRSVVYWGAPRLAMAFITERGKPIAGEPPDDKERRAAMRVRLECPSRYETLSGPKQVGSGHTIDVSSTGIAFTTETLLPADAKLTLLIRWPVRLEGDVPIELHAAGRIARTEATRAALAVENISFSIVE
jgi:hypothetical protein